MIYTLRRYGQQNLLQCRANDKTSSPILLENNDVTDFLFGDYDYKQLSRKGFKEKEVDSWTIDLFRGKLPNGFDTIEEFEEHVLGRLNGKKKE